MIGSYAEAQIQGSSPLTLLQQKAMVVLPSRQAQPCLGHAKQPLREQLDGPGLLPQVSQGLELPPSRSKPQAARSFPLQF